MHGKIKSSPKTNLADHLFNIMQQLINKHPPPPPSLMKLDRPRLLIQLRQRNIMYKEYVAKRLAKFTFLNSILRLIRTPCLDKYGPPELMHENNLLYYEKRRQDVIIRIASKTKWPPHWTYYASIVYVSAKTRVSALIEGLYLQVIKSFLEKTE